MMLGGTNRRGIDDVMNPNFSHFAASWITQGH